MLCLWSKWIPLESLHPCQAYRICEQTLAVELFWNNFICLFIRIARLHCHRLWSPKPFITTKSTPDLILAQINDLRILAGGSDRASKKGCESLLKKRLKKFIQKHTKKGSQAGPLLHNFIWAQPLYRKKNRLGLSRLSLVRKMGAVTVLLGVNAKRPLQGKTEALAAGSR